MYGAVDINWSDATRKGVSSKWKQWYDNNSSSYNYRNYMDLSESTEQKGLDCSGYVGWFCIPDHAE